MTTDSSFYYNEAKPHEKLFNLIIDVEVMLLSQTAYQIFHQNIPKAQGVIFLNRLLYPTNSQKPNTMKLDT